MSQLFIYFVLTQIENEARPQLHHCSGNITVGLEATAIKTNQLQLEASQIVSIFLRDLMCLYNFNLSLLYSSSFHSASSTSNNCRFVKSISHVTKCWNKNCKSIRLKHPSI